MKAVLPVLLSAVLLYGTETAWSQAFPINTNVALQPAQTQLIYRTQLRYRTFDVENTQTEGTTWVQSNVVVYGWTPRLSTVVGLPLVFRNVEAVESEDTERGIGDVNLLVRYQLWKRLAGFSSRSWTLLAGLQAPSYDPPFSSRSWDPILGTVVSWRKNRLGFDGDLIYQFNTENDRDTKAGDVLGYDLVYQYRLSPRNYRQTTKWTVTGLLEFNGEWAQKNELDGQPLNETDRHHLFLSPGVVLSGVRTRFEMGFQLPLFRWGGANAEEDNIRVVGGFTATI